MRSLNGHTETIGLPTDPAELPTAFMNACNTGDAERLNQLYSRAAVLVPEPGHPLFADERVSTNQDLLDLELPITLTLRHLYVAGDIALLITDWSIHGVAADGREVDLEGTATDVAQRGLDGRWRYMIDNPLGSR